VIECIPNISEGLNDRVLDEISEQISSVPGTKLLHLDQGRDANRSVFTFVGSTDSVMESVLRMYRTALNSIDMRVHRGSHPRIGAVDVCPFVPLSADRDLSGLVNSLGKVLGEELSLPVFLYEMSAAKEERRKLYNIRRGEFEGLEAKLKLPEWQPDFGPTAPHPSFGATVLGQRDFLVAFNVSLNTEDLAVAKEIAAEIRELRRREEGQKWGALRAIGWSMPSYHCAQISTNLVDIEQVTLVDCYLKVRELAQQRGFDVIGSELIGLVPERVFTRSGLQIGAVGSGTELNKQVSKFLGLEVHGEFNVEKRILERCLGN